MLASNWRFFGAVVISVGASLGWRVGYAVSCPAVVGDAGASRASVDVCGFRLNAVITSVPTFGDFNDQRSVSGTINGVPVTLSTTAASFRAFDGAIDRLDIVIDGVLEFSGILDSLSQSQIDSEGLRLLALLNQLNTTVTQSETSRVTTSTITSVISARIQDVVRPRFRSSARRLRQQGPGNRHNAGNRNAYGIPGAQDSVPVATYGATGPMSFSTGLAAGEGGEYSVWGGASNTWNSNDARISRFDGTTTFLTVGMDRALGATGVLGIAGGLEYQSLDTDFNDGESKTVGLTVAPYAAVSFFDDRLSADLTLGYSRLTTDTKRSQTRGAVKGNFSGNRFFGASNLAAYQEFGRWVLGLRGGLLASYEKSDSFTESDGTNVTGVETFLLQGSVAAEVRYDLGTWEPSVQVMYLNDLEQSAIDGANADDDEVQIQVGATYLGRGPWAASIALVHSLARRDVDVDTLQANIQYAF